MTEPQRESGVVAQLEAILAGIEARTEHSGHCEYTSSYMGPAMCRCDYAARVRAQVARTVERMGNTLYDYGFSRSSAEGWGAAFQAARPEQEWGQ